ncbi:tripartite tricarboxylate transporter substrate binding protein [Limnohabitans sp. Rim8]|uniref:tripartite tricarboxylate transporter substrate binding protein n=1 Tax=Limnohabitans sp. Rim8 TaxID=1100718 RepID=UPI00260AAF74|nr:tripartite tricarboxylate transporter substrate binding protein [Limnohabitans sp. Rim8]
MQQKTLARLMTALCLGLCLAFTAQAQSTYPSKPIRVIVPYAAGGVVDVQTRALTIGMAKELGQAIVVEAKPGANANIAAEYVARAPADGYTVLISSPFFINNPLLESNLRWASSDFLPVGRFSMSPSYFVVPMSSPAKTVMEYVELAKKAKPALQYADGGQGSTQTMANEMFRHVAGIALESVPYKGAPPTIPDLINGMMSMAITPSSVAVPQIKAGKLRALANINSRRSADLPDVPTIAEAGFPEVTAVSWYGMHVPAGTPPDTVRKLEAAMKAAAATNEVKERLVNAGGEEAFLGQADFVAFIKADSSRWEKVVKIIKK